MKLKVEYIPIEKLTPYENNAKIHTEEQVEQIIVEIARNYIMDRGGFEQFAEWGLL